MPEPPPLRRHQREAREALARHRSRGANRAWVVLPPGAGKTLVGLLETRDHLTDHSHGHVVVLGPNTAIVGQWLAGAAELGLAAGGERDLSAPVTALTYQSLAVFDPDAEVDEEGESTDRVRGALIDQLHPNGRALVDALADTEELLLVLDECHHLLEVWGRLLADVLALLPHARVLGLTATPPEALTPDQAELVGELFGPVTSTASIPAVVREGDLAPFAELAYLVEPTSLEREWIDTEALRFTELTTRLVDPAYGSVGFLAWIAARFVDPVPDVRTWSSVLKDEPELAHAALRMHHADLLDLPDGARPTEEHRRAPSAEDWVLLVSDWVTRHLSVSEDPADAAIVEEVRRALPAVGYHLTRRGIRRGRTPTDRVLARSEAKTFAAADIVAAEHRALGERLRELVLCDHERASATLPIALDGVLAPQAGSAVAALDTLLRDPRTGPLAPVLVTGRTVAGSEVTMAMLRDHVAAADPALAAGLALEPLEGTSATTLTGPGWASRRWVAPVTAFFEAGGCQVLVGTRGLLGEGWNARRATGLVDLTSATSSTAVVQTRGRALRIDPTWPDKVAITWSVVCVSDAHPRGDQDWQRLVRKHTGFFGVDESGDIADGVAHLDGSFSPFAPPPVADLDAINTRMFLRAEDRSAIRDAWRVGEPYADRPAAALRVTRRSGDLLAAGRAPVEVVVHTDRVEALPDVPRPTAGRRDRAQSGALAVAVVLVAAAVAGVLGPAALAGLLLATALLGGAGAYVAARADGRERAAYLRRLADAAARPPSIEAIARAVATGLHATQQASRGADAVEVHVGAGGEHRCVLTGVPEEESVRFAEALDEALAPLQSPRYLVCRHRVSDATVPDVVWSSDLDASTTALLRPDHTTWYAVPSALGSHVDKARAYARAWHEHAGGDPNPLRAGSPEGAGVLAAQAGADPLDVSTVMRRQWE